MDAAWAHDNLPAMEEVISKFVEDNSFPPRPKLLVRMLEPELFPTRPVKQARLADCANMKDCDDDDIGEFASSTRDPVEILHGLWRLQDRVNKLVGDEGFFGAGRIKMMAPSWDPKWSKNEYGKNDLKSFSNFDKQICS